jgi:hypothetical protein
MLFLFASVSCVRCSHCGRHCKLEHH